MHHGASFEPFSRLLVPQRFDGIAVRGFFGGIEAEEDADGAGEEKRDGDDRGL
jgi:hypothetical protein